jgi:tetratricopeptide (TPR) repeat protein
VRAVAAAVVAALVVCAAVPSFAADKRAAAAAFKQGRALYDAGQFSDALDKFEEGYRAYPLPGFLVNIGQCQRKLDRAADAKRSFEQFLASDSSDERTRAEVKEALDEIAADEQRRADAVEDAARRERDAAEARHPAVVDDDKPDLRVHDNLAAAPAANVNIAVTSDKPQDQKKKSKKWVWAIVGVLAAGAVASAVTVGILETRPAPLKPGSLGLLDGRR